MTPGILGEDVTVSTADGRRLRAMVSGPATDTLVVLEAGLGASPLYWQPVQQLLCDDLRVVAYERAGIGGSDPTPQKRTLEMLAADLRSVIDTIPHRRVVLAGHSWGGPITRVAAARRAAAGEHDVAGLVLVDQSDEHDSLFYAEATRRQFAATAAAMRALGATGLIGWVNRALAGRNPTPLRRAALEATRTPASTWAFAAEMDRVVDELKWLRAHPLDLGELPIRVLSGLLAPRFGKRSRMELIAGHHKTAHTYAGAVLVPAYRSEHAIPTTEPGLVAEQIRLLAG